MKVWRLRILTVAVLTVGAAFCLGGKASAAPLMTGTVAVPADAAPFVEQAQYHQNRSRHYRPRFYTPHRPRFYTPPRSYVPRGRHYTPRYGAPRSHAPRRGH